MRNNIVTVVFSGTRRIRTDKLWQYDYGQILRIVGLNLPETFEVHFANSQDKGAAKTSIGRDNSVPIPDEFLTSGEDIYAWIYLHTGKDDGETEYQIVIHVKRRSKPSDEPPTPEEQSVITQIMAALEAAVEKSETNVLHYPTIIDDIWYVWDANINDYVSTDIPATGPEGEQGERGERGNGISDVVLNADYTLTFMFDNGSSYTTTSIRGATGATGASGNGISNVVMNADYTITFTLDDGSTYTTAPIRGATGAQGEPGQKGDAGNGIKSAVLNSDYTLTLTFTDDTVYTTPSIRGATGPTGATGSPGVGIENVVLNSDYTLTLTFTDGTTYTTTSIRGAKGETGAQGPQGIQGQTGATGNGIDSVALNSDYTLTIVFTDGTSYTTPTSIRGATGATGPQGPAGYSPSATVSKTGTTATITITDQTGTTTAQITDGTNYVLTNQDKADIADIVAAEIGTADTMSF